MAISAVTMAQIFVAACRYTWNTITSIFPLLKVIKKYKKSLGIALELSNIGYKNCKSTMT
jgi:hypothetical protein